MTTTANNDDLLKDILSKVNEWLKFAETKNGANASLCLISTISLFRLLGAWNTKDFWFLYISMTCVLLLISATISLISFIPKLKAPWVIGTEDRNESDNMLFFSHACKYNENEFLGRLLGTDHQASEIEKMYASQITINARIADAKFKQFNVAIWFTITALISPIGAFIIYQLKS